MSSLGTATSVAHAVEAPAVSARDQARGGSLSTPPPHPGHRSGERAEHVRFPREVADARITSRRTEDNQGVVNGLARTGSTPLPLGLDTSQEAPDLRPGPRHPPAEQRRLFRSLRCL